MSALIQDLRYGARLLWKDKVLTATILATLAVCIGANATVYSVIDRVMLDPLPYPESDRLVYVYNSYPEAGAPRGSSSAPDYFYRRESVSAFEEVAQYRVTGITVGEAGEAARLGTMRVTPSFFGVLGTTAVHGRTFIEDEAEVGSADRVVLSHGYWQERFGGDPTVVGTDMRVDGRPHTVVGVLPAGFRPPTDAEARFYMPIPYEPEERTPERLHDNIYQMIARLAPGATVEQAESQIASLDQTLSEQWPIPNGVQVLEDAGYHVVVVNLQEDATRDIRPVLWLLWAGVAFVLLIGCVNIANLMVARTTIRTQELATRLALGADRGRVARQLVTEAVLVALIGGLIGLALGAAGLRLLEAFGLDDLPLGVGLALDGDVLLFTLAIAVIAGLVFGGIPLIHLFRSDLTAAFRSESRGGTASRRAVTLRSVLVTGQVGLAFVLLIGAGLMLASFRSALAVDPGFRPDSVLIGQITLPETDYPTDEDQRQFVTELLEEVRAIPGVAAASLTHSIPFGSTADASAIQPEGYTAAPGEAILAPFRTMVAPDYFRAMGIPLVDGREFEEADTEGATRVMVIDRWLAERYWPGESPLGRRMLRGAPGMPDLSEDDFFTIVGVVESVKQHDLTEEERAGAYYFALAQEPWRSLTLVVRTEGDPLSVTPAVRRIIAGIDPDLPVYGARTLRSRIDDSLQSRRVPMALMGLFAGVAVFLAAVGIYGVLAYAVTQRRREIGIRLALGSSPAEVFRMVVGQGSRVLAIGLLLGGAVTVLLVGLIRSLLFGVQPGDPVVIGTVALLLAGIGMAATVVPARRATRIHPVEALSE
jgi:predicted permease